MGARQKPSRVTRRQAFLQPISSSIAAGAPAADIRHANPSANVRETQDTITQWVVLRPTTNINYILPSASLDHTGVRYTIVNKGGSSVTVQASGSDGLDFNSGSCIMTGQTFLNLIVVHSGTYTGYVTIGGGANTAFATGSSV